MVRLSEVLKIITQEQAVCYIRDYLKIESSLPEPLSKKELIKIIEYLLEAIEMSSKVISKKEFVLSQVAMFGLKGDKVSDLLTAIAWADYPDKAFTTLVESVEKIEPDIAKDLESEGINFRVLGKGEVYCVSNKQNFNEIAIDTEKWDADFSDHKKNQELINDSQKYVKFEPLRKAIAKFESDVILEIKAWLDEHEIKISDLEEWVKK